MENLQFKRYKQRVAFSIFLILEIALMIFLFSFFSSSVNGSTGGNVTVRTNLTVINSAPEIATLIITNVSTSFSGSNVNVTLNPGDTKITYCNGIARDWNNGTAIVNITARLFYNGSLYGDSDDNNTHYSNDSCYINSNVYNTLYGDDSSGNYTVNYSCSFNMQYYTNPGTWNCTVYATNLFNLDASSSVTASVNQLMAMTLPSSIDYGAVNSTYVSGENMANVSNAGNIMLNLSLQGYAISVGDGLAMNCSRGNLKNISIVYEKYNLTASNPVITGLSDFESKYTNITNASVVKKLSLNYRQNDGFDDAINTTYWRIYVPRGVAGSCSGNIIFGATTANGV